MTSLYDSCESTPGSIVGKVNFTHTTCFAYNIEVRHYSQTVLVTLLLSYSTRGCELEYRNTLGKISELIAAACREKFIKTKVWLLY